jgi:hypothetical protein
MNEEIAHEVERCNFNGINTQARAPGSGSNFRWYFYQFNVLHEKVLSSAE